VRVSGSGAGSSSLRIGLDITSDMIIEEMVTTDLSGCKMHRGHLHIIAIPGILFGGIPGTNCQFIRSSRFSCFNSRWRGWVGGWPGRAGEGGR